MALAGEAWIVRDRDFRHRETLNLEKGRQESVHPFEEFEVLDALPLEGAVRTAGITDLFARQFVPHPIGDARRGDAYETVPLAARLDTRAANAIELLQRLQKPRKLFRIILQIGVERYEILAASSLQAGPTGRGFTAVERKSLDADQGVSSG